METGNRIRKITEYWISASEMIIFMQLLNPGVFFAGLSRPGTFLLRQLDTGSIPFPIREENTQH